MTDLGLTGTCSGSCICICIRSKSRPVLLAGQEVLDPSQLLVVALHLDVDRHHPLELFEADRRLLLRLWPRLTALSLSGTSLLILCRLLDSLIGSHVGSIDTLRARLLGYSRVAVLLRIHPSRTSGLSAKDR